MKKREGLATQAEYARHRGVNRSHICRLAQRGILVLVGQLVDVAASDAVLDDRPTYDDPAPAAPQPRTTEPAGSQQPQSGTFAQARLVDMTYRAKLRRLEFDARQGKMIEASAVKQSLADAGRGVRDGILGIPDRLAATLAAETDQSKIHMILKTELTRELARLADAIDAI
jgi:hypothetical protein